MYAGGTLVAVAADAEGNWMADFSGVADILWKMPVSAEQDDADHDRTSTSWIWTWTDLTQDILDYYDVTYTGVAGFSKGYEDGTWRPYAEIDRLGLTVAAVRVFEIPLVHPATPTFTDVPEYSPFYESVEGAVAAGLVNGVTVDEFDPAGIVSPAARGLGRALAGGALRLGHRR